MGGSFGTYSVRDGHGRPRSARPWAIGSTPTTTTRTASVTCRRHLHGVRPHHGVDARARSDPDRQVRLPDHRGHRRHRGHPVQGAAPSWSIPRDTKLYSPFSDTSQDVYRLALKLDSELAEGLILQQNAAFMQRDLASRGTPRTRSSRSERGDSDRPEHSRPARSVDGLHLPGRAGVEGQDGPAGPHHSRRLPVPDGPALHAEKDGPTCSTSRTSMTIPSSPKPT